MRLHSNLPNVRSLSVHIAQEADPAASVVFGVADAVLNHIGNFGGNDRYYATKILDHLQAGVTPENLTERARMLTGKAKRLARSHDAHYMVLGVEALTADLDEHPDSLLLFAHHLAHVLSKARQWGVRTSVQLNWLEGMQGEVGERLRSHALAGASDVPVTDKIAQVTRRLASSTATAEDLALVTDILSYSPTPDDLTAWTEALGTPSPPQASNEDQIPLDWARAWRWAAVLPGHLLTAWRDAIDYVSERHGTPDPQALTGNRWPRWEFSHGKSPYSAKDLSTRTPLEAASLVAAWQPDTESERQMFGRLELAQALGEAVKADPVRWGAAPQDVVYALGKPLYIEYYFRALSERAVDIISQAPAVLAAAMASPSASEAQTVDQDTQDTERGITQEVVLDLVKALANKDGDLAASLNDLWEIALTAVQSFSGADDGLLFSGQDPLASAINRLWGHGLQTVLALAAWEFRRYGSVRPEFEESLDAVIEMVDSTGLELRAILASHRPLLEGIAGAWLKAHAAPLFREGELAQETFDLTVKWSRPTKWFYREFESELFNAALRGVDNAISLILIATLNEEHGYGLGTLIERLGKDIATLATAAETAALLAQNAEPGSCHLAVAIRFWTLLLDTDRNRAPAQALTRLGRWAFVDNIDDDQWAHLTARTLEATDGQIDDSISVADRAARIPPTSISREILLRLLDNGEHWERHHAAIKALDLLRASATQPADDSFRRLRTRLIDLGHHEATDIKPLDKNE